MGNPPPGIEGQIYRELRRTTAAPQGICVMNSAGKALAWSLGFEDDDSVAEFFDYAKERYETHPSSGVATERFHRYPTRKMEDVADDGEELKIPIAHAEGDRCPGDLPRSKGSIAGRIVGRAHGDDGVSDVRTQDNYIEDTLEITKDMQDQLLAKAQGAEGKFKLPEALVREIVSNAYLGMLDVNPLGGDRVRGKIIEESLELWGEKQGDGPIIIFGTSLANGRDGGTEPGRKWSHRVKLDWRGFADVDEDGIRELALAASGTERLKWGGPGSHVPENAGDNPVAHLLSGRPLDIDCAVRYGATAKR